MDRKLLCCVLIFGLIGTVIVEGNEDGCSAFCVQATTGTTCNNVTGECLQGCQPGYAGTRCNIQCCPNCKDCSLSNGSITAITCNECGMGYYSSNGDCKPCSEMCATNDSSPLSVCRATDGQCEFGCKAGYYGDMCMGSCSATCSGNTCNAVDGTCLNGCTLSVLTGPKCMDSCSAGCVNRECSQDGACLQSCTQNYWNTNCVSPCGSNCQKPVDQDSRVCNETNGDCLHGCVNDTSWDGDCTTECSATCANQKCQYATGNCADGCVDEYEGPKCAEKVKADNNLKTIGIGVGVGVGVLLILIIIVAVMCWRKKKKF